MIFHQSHIDIDRPTDYVYDFLTDLSNLTKWQSGVTQSKVLTPGPLRVGTEFTETVRMLELFRFEVTCVITEASPGQAFGFKSIGSQAMEYQGSFALERHGAGSRLSFTGTTTLRGLWRWLEPLFAKEIEQALTKELERIKAGVESAAGTSAAAATA